MTILLPRLCTSDAKSRMNSLAGRSLTEIAAQADADLAALYEQNVHFAAVGGDRFELQRCRELREQLRGLAARAGYPGARTLAAQQKFDLEVALFLRALSGLEAGEAIRAEPWQYICCGLVPELVFWRWTDGEGEPVPTDRYLGVNRNCFGRLWQRATVFWDPRLADPSTLVRELREDNFTAILERSRFSAYPAINRELARAYLLRRSLARLDGRTREEDFLRDSMRRIVRASGWAALWALEPAELEAFLGATFDESLRAMGLAPVENAELLRRWPYLQVSKATDAFVSCAGTATEPPERPVASTPVDIVPFATLDMERRAHTVWQILHDHDEARVHDMVVSAAQRLRERGQLDYMRLRKDGQIYDLVKRALDAAVRRGWIEVSAVGKRRVVTRTVP